MKTREEILEQLNFFIAEHRKKQILNAMQEYSDQENTELKEDLKNEEAKYEEISMVLYEVRKENTKLKEENIELQKRREKLDDVINDLAITYNTLKIKAEKLYSTLEWYSDSSNYCGENGELATSWKPRIELKAKQALEEYKK